MARGKQEKPKKEPMSGNPRSATCPRCQASVPANSSGQPMAHYKGDGKTWCK